MFLIQKKPDSFLAVTDEERQKAIENLVGSTTLRQGYYLLLILSVAIVTPGLLFDNATIVIGGMVIAPLLTPILTLAVSFVARSKHGVLHAMKTLMESVVIAVALACLMTWLIGHSAQESMHPETTVDIGGGIYFFVAFCSGIIAAFAWVKEELSNAIAGIAISISLLPPLCDIGINLALYDYDPMRDAAVLFATNVFGILLASTITFLLLGFQVLTRVTEKTVQKEEKKD